MFLNCLLHWIWRVFIQLFLQVFKQFHHVTKNADMSLHLVEVSPKMSAMQAAKLTDNVPVESSDTEMDENKIPYRQAISKTGVPVSWYTHLSQVPKGERVAMCFV